LDRLVADNKTSAGAAFPGKGKLRPEDERVRALEAQVKHLTTERDILKNAPQALRLPAETIKIGGSSYRKRMEPH
jgi:hypothetical protein